MPHNNSKINFSLFPFPGLKHPELSLGGHYRKKGQNLELTFEVRGDLKALLVPLKTALPLRQDELWKHTCFECFIKPEGSPSYFEFNFSPSGNFNCYTFSSYRQNQHPEKRISELPIESTKAENYHSLNTIIPLSLLPAPCPSFQLGLTAVLEASDQSISYWALKHASTKPDFHVEESFIINVLNFIE